MSSVGRSLAAGGLLAGVLGLSVARVMLAPRATAAFRADEPTRRALFAAMAGAEPAYREGAARQFPGDLWSADDDFHGRELRLASSLAAQYGLGIADVLRAMDDGLHASWPVWGPRPLPSSPPCHPRPIY